MTERERLDVWEERLEIYNRDGGICQYCGKHVDINAFQVAHRIANVIWARKKYGGNVIDHVLNKACTHGGACNDLIQITHNQIEVEALVNRIREEINGGY